MAKKKQKLDLDDLESLALEMSKVRARLDALPFDQRLTTHQLELLEDVRYQGRRLADVAETTIECFEENYPESTT